MEQEFTYKGEIHKVKIEINSSDYIKAESYKASYKDKNFSLNVAKITPNCFSISFDGGNKTVHIAQSDNSVFVHLDGRVVRFGKVKDDIQKFSADGLGFGAKDEIKASMPGKIVKILVAEGDKVKSGQPLVIVESMKMENEIKSPADATVKSINFKPGDLVQPNQPIINLEPDGAGEEQKGKPA